MNIFYFYLILLLLIFVLLYKGISLSINFAPTKIKLLSIFAFILLPLRYMAVFIFLISKTIKYLYILKPIIFLNLLCIPILAMVGIYIFARKDRIKLSYFIIVSTMMLLLYILAITKLQVNIEIYKNLGYRMYFLNNNLIVGIYLAINTIFFFSSLILLGNSITNRLGMWLTLVSSLVVMLETTVNILGISLLPMLILGDVFWIITADYALFKLKK